MVGDAETRDRRAGAVGGGEGEGHPGTDAADPHAGRQPARAANRPAAGTAAQAGRQATHRAHDRTARHAEQLQHDVAAAARHRVQEEDSGTAHGQHRDGQGPQVQLVLADLADDHQDKECVDHVHVYVHAFTVPPGTHPEHRPTGGRPG